MAGCTSPIGGGISISDIVEEQFDFFTDLVEKYIADANEFSQQLEDFNVEPIQLDPIIWDESLLFIPFEAPEAPEPFEPPAPEFTNPLPNAPDIADIDTSGLDSVDKPPDNLADPPVLRFPPQPVAGTVPDPGDAPIMTDVVIPVYVAGPLPEVPTLYELHLPEPPDISFEELEVIRPIFIPPDALQDYYRPDVIDFQNLVWEEINANVAATGVTDVHARLQEMLAGGTGLPIVIEQALFDRAIMRDDKSSVQAVAQMETEWAAKGFSLPGSTLLARSQEMRQANRMERGRINRELSIQFHTQEIENLRFAVTNAISLEGTLLEIEAKIYDIARLMADGHWEVLKGIYDSALSIFRLQLEIYKSDLDAQKALIEIELAKLEVYKGQLEAQRLIGMLNQQLVEIYKTEVEAFLASVEVYKAQVAGAEAQIHAELAKMEGYKAEIDAYTARLGAEKLKVDIYTATVAAEETKVKVYQSQVEAFTARIEGYKAEVGAEATKIQAEIGVAEAETKLYATLVDAWQAGIQADSTNLQALVEVYRANVSAYTAKLGAEQYRVTGESRNFEMTLEKEKARVEASLKQMDQAIEQLKHATSMGLSATEIASKVNAQLASSAMAAINVSAGMSLGNSLSSSDSRSCSTSYSGII